MIRFSENLSEVAATNIKPNLPFEFIIDLQKSLSGEVRLDPTTRVLYSTDASIYQIEPLGVVFPRTLDDLATTVEIAARYDVPILARGSGSSLAGQAIGSALILDCSRYLDKIHSINPEDNSATVEPGVILNTLNRETAKYGLQFGPDPASAERATLGGSIANNASGAHSILYGMSADHILSADVVLADGSLAVFELVTEERARQLAGYNNQSSVTSNQLLINNDRKNSTKSPLIINDRGSSFYRAALNIRDQYADAIRLNWPHTWRCASGYNVNYLLPWSPSQPPWWFARQITNPPIPYPPIQPGCMNLAPLLAGSEGTLAVIRKVVVRLVPQPRHTILGVMSFDSVFTACEAVPDLLERGPSAVELIPQNLIHLARGVPAYAHQLSFLDPLVAKGNEPPALLVVEFTGEDMARLKEQVKSLRDDVLIAETNKAQQQVWAVRKMGLGILMSRPGDLKPVAFIEDLSVPVEHLTEFVREMEKIMAAHGTRGDFYAHASAGCLHLRPILNLKTAQGVAELRAIAEETSSLVLRLKGAMSGEHGDGLARSEWVEKMYGREITTAFRELKQAADPKGLLNPGKILNSPKMNENLRYGTAYRAQGWRTILDFSTPERPSGVEGWLGAIEQCNGAGVCRKIDGVMCPSFQATQDEMHSTRGRANLLRTMIAGKIMTKELAEKSVRDALDLCLACKGCKSECPSGVDMAKLKYEFTYHYYKSQRRRLRDFLFGYIGWLAPLGRPFASIINPLMDNPTFQQLGERMLGISRHRPFPHFVGVSSRNDFINKTLPASVLFLSDTFNHFFYPEVEQAALKALFSTDGVRIIPVLGAGRTLISKGFLPAAKKHAARLVETIYRLDPIGEMPIVGIEPSEIYTLRDEFINLLPSDNRMAGLAQRSFMIDEYLIRPGSDRKPRINHLVNQKIINGPQPTVVLHGHCYQKAQPPSRDGYPIGVSATVAMLEAMGYPVILINDGCCGMAGAFGYEVEHYDLSMKVGELALFPAIRSAVKDTHKKMIFATSGISCRSQIKDGTGHNAIHPIMLI